MELRADSAHRGNVISREVIGEQGGGFGWFRLGAKIC
jgi:hypothetical protein